LRDDPRDAFAALDGNADGTMTEAEFAAATQAACNPPLTASQANGVFNNLDVNGDHSLALLEFANAMQAGHWLDPVTSTVPPLSLNEYHERMGHISEVATVSVHVNKVDFNHLTTMEKSNVRQAFVTVLSEAAGVPRASVRDLAGVTHAVSLSANDLGTPGQVQVGTTAQAMIDVPASPLSGTIVHWIANASTKAHLATEISAVPGVQQAVNGWPLTQADVLVAVRRQNEDAFRTLDDDSNGNLNFAEFESAVGAFQPPLNHAEADYAFTGLDANHDGHLNALEFEGYGIHHFGETPNALSQLPVTAAASAGAGGAPITMADFRQRMGEATPVEVFNTLDSQGDGSLDLDELVVGGEAFTPPLPAPVAEYVFRGLDANSDNQVTHGEYDAALAANQFAFAGRRLRSTATATAAATDGPSARRDLVSASAPIHV
jgi:Ca2+-binding EF-hand superfamily protein